VQYVDGVSRKQRQTVSKTECTQVTPAIFGKLYRVAGCSDTGDIWRLGVMVNIVGRINEVNQRRARLVLGWVTILGG